MLLRDDRLEAYRGLWLVADNIRCRGVVVIGLERLEGGDDGMRQIQAKQSNKCERLQTS